MMQRKKKGGDQVSTSRVKDDVERLTALVEAQGRVLEEQRRRLEELEQRDAGSDAGSPNANGNGHGNGESRHSRRDLLRLAGLAAAGAAGAAGAAALTSMPAAAANGGNFLLGSANDADATTSLAPTTTAPTGSTDGSGLNIDSSKAGAVTASSTFYRAVHGTSPKSGATISGVGVWGSSADGAGVIGSSSTGVDLWAFNTGRLMQSTQAAGQPTYQGGVYDGTLAVWTDLELVRDVNGVVWVYVPPSVNGATVGPDATHLGNWFPLQLGGVGVSGVANHPDSQGVLFSAVSNSLLALKNSDGQTFQDMMVDTAYVPATPAQLVLSITPAFDCLALITGSADLYTDTAGYNQDIGIYVSPSDTANPPNNTQHIEAWKESGGFAGTNSPNAAFVQTIFNMSLGTTYDVRLKWKANKNAPGATIRAGAGPFGGSSLATNASPTRLTALLLVHG